MDYKEYTLSLKEKAISILVYLGVCGIITFFFYRSLYVFLALIPGIFLFFKYIKKELCERRKKKLKDEFSETLYSVSVNMRAGYSIENAFLEAYRDLMLFYGEKSLMAKEVMRIRKGLEINITLEELVEDLSERSGVEEIKMFGDVMKSAKRNGGNITEVLSSTADRIRESICVDAEIETILSEKKLELRIMEGMPFLILMYLEVTSVGYFDVLYVGIRGRLFMTMALLLYVAAIILGNIIMKIKV